MTPFPSDPLASTLHDFRAAAFALPYRDWDTLPAHTQEQWRRIADRIAPRLHVVSGRMCFEAWAADLNTTWAIQPVEMRAKWSHMADLIWQDTMRKVIKAA